MSPYVDAEDRAMRLRAALEVVRYDYVVINDDLDRAVDEMRTIALAERNRVTRRLVGGASR